MDKTILMRTETEIIKGICCGGHAIYQEKIKKELFCVPQVIMK